MSKVAIVGAGVSGLSCAFALADLAPTIYEKEPQAGGHANTVRISHNGEDVDVDSAFMVYNRRNYPHFCRLLADLGVSGRATSMSFSVRHEGRGLEYNGGDIGGLLADWRNATRSDFWRLLADILRFNRAARRDIAAGRLAEGDAIADYVSRLRLSDIFSDAYLLPMGASIWSCGLDDFARAPAEFALRFFDNHGLLALANRPQWMRIDGGSRRYVDALIAALRPDSLRSGRAATAARVDGDGVVVSAGGAEEKYDAVVIASHAPDALRLIEGATADETAALSAFRYVDTAAVLHTDVSVLPSRRRAWAAWNYRVFGGGEAAATYNLTMLQHLDGRQDAPLLMTLNAGISHVDDRQIKARFRYAHPLPDAAAERGKTADINGRRGLFFCGSYWGAGFHEDGAASGAAAAAGVRDYLRRRAAGR